MAGEARSTASRVKPIVPVHVRTEVERAIWRASWGDCALPDEPGSDRYWLDVTTDEVVTVVAESLRKYSEVVLSGRFIPVYMWRDSLEGCKGEEA